MSEPVSAAEPLLHVALVQPEIGPNTGNIGRLCLGLGARLHLVHPLGFSTSEKAVRRAGLDYWRHVDVVEHPDLEAFETWARGRQLVSFSARAEAPFTAAAYPPGVVLVFGSESVGLPPSWRERHPTWRIPLVDDRVRSLNLANSVAVATYHALQRLRPEVFAGPGEQS